MYLEVRKLQIQVSLKYI